MKKYFSYLMLALAAVFTACEDVPEPYGLNFSKTSGGLIDGQVLNESFVKSAGSFTSKAVNGNYLWTWTSQGGGCMKVTSYVDNTNNPADVYLISPAIQLENKAYHLAFQYILRYAAAATLKENHTVLVSTDYAGDPAAATWEDLGYAPVQGNDWNTWSDADLDIPESCLGKTIYLALRYIGTSEKAATWEVKNMVVAEGTAGSGGGGDEVIFSESFASGLGGFTIELLSNPDNLENIWVSDTKYSCAKATAFVNNSNHASEALLVSPVIDLSGVQNAILTFEHASKFFAQSAMDDCSLLVRELDKTRSASDWLIATVPAWPVNDKFQFTSSDEIDLKAFVGKKIQIAFKYTSTANTAGTWEIKNVKIVDSTGSGGSGGSGGDTGETKSLPYQEPFSNDFGAFFQQLTSGSGAWVIDFKTAKATGYDNSTKKTTAGTYFLISPAIELPATTAAHVSYEYILRYNKGDENQQVLISDDYDKDATKATWIVLKKNHTEGSDWNTFSTADVTVPASFGGKTVRIAFVYNTNATSGSTWEVKNFAIQSGSAQEEADGSTYGGGATPVGPTPTPSGEATGTGTLQDPFNFIAATNAASALDADAISTQSYYIKGKISEIKYPFDVQHGTATFFITDDGNKADGQFQVYSTLYLGNRKWAEGDTQIAVGDEVIIYGQLVNFKGTTPETASQKSYLYSLNGVTDGGDPIPGGDPTPGGDPLAAFTNGGFENWTEGVPDGWKTETTICNATLSLDRDSHSGDYAVRVAGDKNNNKRLGCTEMTLPAGTYNCSFWVKSASATEVASVCPGHAVAGSTITYNYDKGQDGKNRYINDISGTWQQVSYSFTLNDTKKVSVIVMNSKNPGIDVLIDDFTITKQ